MRPEHVARRRGERAHRRLPTYLPPMPGFQQRRSASMTRATAAHTMPAKCTDVHGDGAAHRTKRHQTGGTAARVQSDGADQVRQHISAMVPQSQRLDTLDRAYHQLEHATQQMLDEIAILRAEVASVDEERGGDLSGR